MGCRTKLWIECLGGITVRVSECGEHCAGFDSASPVQAAVKNAEVGDKYNKKYP